MLMTNRKDAPFFITRPYARKFFCFFFFCFSVKANSCVFSFLFNTLLALTAFNKLETKLCPQKKKRKRDDSSGDDGSGSDDSGLRSDSEPKKKKSKKEKKEKKEKKSKKVR